MPSPLPQAELSIEADEHQLVGVGILRQLLVGGAQVLHSNKLHVLVAGVEGLALVNLLQEMHLLVQQILQLQLLHVDLQLFLCLIAGHGELGRNRRRKRGEKPAWSPRLPAASSRMRLEFAALLGEMDIRKKNNQRIQTDLELDKQEPAESYGRLELLLLQHPHDQRERERET